MVINSIYVFLNVFCGTEEEETTMEEWMVVVGNTMQMFVAEVEMQGLVNDG